MVIPKEEIKSELEVVNEYYLRFFGKGLHGTTLDIEAEELEKGDLEHLLESFGDQYDMAFLYKYRSLNQRAKLDSEKGEYNLKTVFHSDRPIPKQYGDRW